MPKLIQKLMAAALALVLWAGWMPMAQADESPQAGFWDAAKMALESAGKVDVIRDSINVLEDVVTFSPGEAVNDAESLIESIKNFPSIPFGSAQPSAAIATSAPSGSVYIPLTQGNTVICDGKQPGSGVAGPFFLNKFDRIDCSLKGRFHNSKSLSSGVVTISNDGKFTSYGQCLPVSQLDSPSISLTINPGFRDPVVDIDCEISDYTGDSSYQVFFTRQKIGEVSAVACAYDKSALPGPYNDTGYASTHLDQGGGIPSVCSDIGTYTSRDPKEYSVVLALLKPDDIARPDFDLITCSNDHTWTQPDPLLRWQPIKRSTASAGCRIETQVTFKE